MKASQNAINLIKKFESLKLESYPDPGSTTGLPYTIGYGHTKGVIKGQKTTVEEANEFLATDVAEVSKSLSKTLTGAEINQNEYDALISLVFNIGIGNFNKSTVKKRLLEGNKLGAANAFEMWIKNDGEILPGLIKRRAAEKALFLKPIDDSEIQEVSEQEVAEIKTEEKKPLFTVKEIGAGIAVGTTSTVNFVSNIDLNTLITTQQSVRDLRDEIKGQDNPTQLHNYILSGISIFIFLIGAFIIFKRVVKRKKGK